MALSKAEMRSLRPILLRDVRVAAATLYNDPRIKTKELNSSLQHCTFSKIKLGPLGTAVVVDWPAIPGAANSSMINVYLPEGKSWRKVAEGAGFGPRVVPRVQGIPDLVYGWTTGVCHATFNRYAYRKGSYQQDACDQEAYSSDSRESTCGIIACEGPKKWPTFEEPWPVVSSDDGFPKTISNGVGPCTPQPTLEPAVATVVPGNSITFVISARFTGTCPSDSLSPTGGSWTTSDPLNTAVSSRGVVTCLHVTPQPVTIRYSGTSGGEPFSYAKLECR